MKIAIITFSCAFNYGAMLQTYGLYNYLKEKGNDVFIIDYIPERYNLDAPNYADKAIQRTRLWKYIPFAKIIWKRTHLIPMKKNRTNFRIFLEKNIIMTHKYFSLEELQKDIPKADLYITGSDQVWNPDFVWQGNIDKPYYLAFLPDSAYRVSYASSFGKNQLTESESWCAKEYLEKYMKLSVREKQGVDILNKMGLKAVEVADPTILASKKTFVELAHKKKNIKTPYLLLFQINFNMELFRVCKAVTKKKGLKMIVLIPDVFQASKVVYNGKVVLPSVEEWIDYFMNASYVVTDSFHATVFSIIFERPFSSCVFSGYSGRIHNILDKTDLQDRILLEADMAQLQNQIEKRIQFDEVNKKIKIWQDKSRKWLDDTIKQII